jgi:parallel beta-helix repeat protein
LIGEDRDTTIIDGSNLGDVVDITKSYVTIESFTIRNSGNSEFDAGVKVWTTYTKILNSYFTNNHRAIFLEVGSYVTIIQGNEIIDNYHGVYSFTGSLDNTITDNIIRLNNRSAVYLYGSHFNNIHGNTFSNNGNGVVLNYGQDNLISNNIVENNIYCGILLIDMSDRTKIFNNTISNTINLEGIALVESSSNKIKNNTIVGNNYNGIGLVDSSDNDISYNLICENKEVGLSLSEACENNIVNCNNFEGNVKANFEVHLLCTDNLFYQNNFLTSTLDSFDNGVNRWDDSKYGNYWSDYEERYPDAKKEFLRPWMWDTPYELPKYGDNQDNCPLIDQWSNSVSKDIQQDKPVNRPILNWLQSYSFCSHYYKN